MMLATDGKSEEWAPSGACLKRGGGTKENQRGRHPHDTREKQKAVLARVGKDATWERIEICYGRVVTSMAGGWGRNPEKKENLTASKGGGGGSPCPARTQWDGGEANDKINPSSPGKRMSKIKNKKWESTARVNIKS